MAIPDGPTIDAEGYVWISLYAGWEARRYSPAGDLVERVRFPVSNITKIAFGGDDLRTAYATTARQMLQPETIAKQPLIGDLVRVPRQRAGSAMPARPSTDPARPAGLLEPRRAPTIDPQFGRPRGDPTRASRSC